MFGKLPVNCCVLQEKEWCWDDESCKMMITRLFDVVIAQLYCFSVCLQF